MIAANVAAKHGNVQKVSGRNSVKQTLHMPGTPAGASGFAISGSGCGRNCAWSGYGKLSAGPDLDLSRFCAAPLITYRTAKEIKHRQSQDG